MKNFTTAILILLLCCIVPTQGQTLTNVLLPKYIEGLNGTNSNRLPFAYRATITGLKSNVTYRYINQFVISTDGATTSGAGNVIFVSTTGGLFTRTSGPSLSTAGNFGTFTTDSSGTYTGWFVSEPTSNARFAPGKYIFLRIMLNDGGTGTATATRLTPADSVCVLKIDVQAQDSCGTGLRGMSPAKAKDFVFLYDNVSGTGRPVSGTYVESDGSANTTANSYSSFYATKVDSVSGAFGTIIPNTLTDGVQRIERRSLIIGSIIATAIDSDGVWPSGVDTRNATGGATALTLSLTDVASLSQRPVIAVPLRDTIVMDTIGEVILSTNIRQNIVDREGDSLSFVVNCAANLLVGLSGDTLRVKQFAGKSYPGIPIVLVGTDPYGLSVSDTVLITINHKNRAPFAFSLATPTMGDTVKTTTALITVTWTKSSDADADSLTYLIRIAGGTLDTLYKTRDTVVKITASRFTASTTYNISAWVTDGVDTTKASNSRTIYTAAILTSALGVAAGMPVAFALQQNFPNPFNPSTTIKFSLAVDSRTTLTVYDCIGREVASLVNASLAAGSQQFTFNGSRLMSGVYFYRLTAHPNSDAGATPFTDVKKFILLK